MSGMLWELRITSFRGMSFNAEHYYPALTEGAYTVRVDQVLSERAAAKLTRKEHGSFTWRPGSHVNSFDTEEDCRKAGVAVFTVLASEEDCLVTDESYAEGKGEWLAGAPRTDQADFQWTNSNQLRARQALELFPREVPVMLVDGDWVVAELARDPYDVFDEVNGL